LSKKEQKKSKKTTFSFVFFFSHIFFVFFFFFLQKNEKRRKKGKPEKKEIKKTQILYTLCCQRMNRKKKHIQFFKKHQFAHFFSTSFLQSSSAKQMMCSTFFASSTSPPMNVSTSLFFENGFSGVCLFSSKMKKDFSLFFSKKEKTEKNTKYILQKYQRSNQDTLIFQRPLVREGEWIQSGDILADCSTSLGGELCLGKNICIAYMPWEGYNYEDAILISQRLVTEDVYTSIHIESYEVETRNTKLGREQITKNIPEVPESQLSHLDERGIVKRGTSVKEGDILVGKVTPVQKKFLSAYEKLLYTILEKELIPMRDTSLRTPKGLKAKVLEIKILNSSIHKRNILSEKVSKNKKKFFHFFQQSGEKRKKAILLNPFFTQKIGTVSNLSPEKKEVFFEKNFSQKNKNTFSFFVPSFLTKTKKEKNQSTIEKSLLKVFLCTKYKFYFQKNRTFFFSFRKEENEVSHTFESSQLFNTLESGNGYFHSQNFAFPQNEYRKPEKVQVYLVEKRKIQVGDKMSGRHGNKGIVSQILPLPDMPFLPDGTPLDMVLNPLGVPSRMNVGQIYECILGLASKYLQEYYRIQPFDEIYGPQASRSFTFSKLYEARQKTSQKWLLNPCYPGKIQIFDGCTGEPYENPVTVGISYILKLVHLVDDKIHARSTGPYSLVTQQPLKGRSKYGGQRLGEMEVWAVEAYGAAFVLLEMLTIKSDDISGRMTLWSNILLNMPIYIGTPESFKVLVCELQALCLDMGLYRLNKKGFLTQIKHLMQLP
jgi:DNA-directed RNA polymerase subunit beta